MSFTSTNTKRDGQFVYAHIYTQKKILDEKVLKYKKMWLHLIILKNERSKVKKTAEKRNSAHMKRLYGNKKRVSRFKITT